MSESKQPKARKAKAKKEASLEEPSATEPAGQVQPLDFSKPTKFTPEIRHRITAALTPFCETLGLWLGGELKREVTIELDEIAQHTWAAAKAHLPVESLAVAVEETAIQRHMLLSIELPFVLQSLECLLGGAPAQTPAPHHLSEIDWVLTRGLLDGIVGELSQGWSELGGPELARGEVDLEGDAGVLTPAGEPTLVVGFTTAVAGVSSAMSLLIPWAAVAPIAESIRSAGAPASAPASPGGALRHGLSSAQVLLRAEVGSVQMGIEPMLELTPGSLLVLQDRAEEGVVLYAEGVSIARGRPGRSGTRRAIKLESTGEPPVRADTYATLGRAELERARAHAAEEPSTSVQGPILHSLFVRVWAELGRTHLPLGQALELSTGVVVELDQDAQAPVELFANGLCFASGSLVVTGEGRWGVQLEQLL
ncbi:MAG TPA: FliM/FliN family flagellar motor switch protein [Solirubrobacteraceae bacterium]|nr:FliM/FliN family flagellar motor switch protein [Solirubrobacteraceae bacterium]